MLWIIATALILALALWALYLRPYKHWKRMGVPQTRPWIFFGDVSPLIFRFKDPMEWLDWIYYMYPERKYVGMYQFYSPILVLRDPDLIKQIAVKDFDYFTDHNSFTISEDVDPLWSKNLFSLKGQKWRDMRASISGSFTSSKMRIMYGLILEESEKFVNHFLKKDEKVLDVEIKNLFIRYTNDVIASTSFGIKVDSLENPDNDFFLMGRKVTNFGTIKMMFKLYLVLACPWLFKLFKIRLIDNSVRTFFCKMIDENIRAREEKGIVRPDLINLLLEFRRSLQKRQEKAAPDTCCAIAQESEELVTRPKNPIGITNMDIAAQALSFFLAGFDSVANAICFACYELAVNPDIQDELRKEIKIVHTKTNGKPTYEDLLGMKYLDMVITESLRKWPVTPVTDRVCVKPYTLLPSSAEDQSITFKKGDNISIFIYNIHHDRQYYSDPEKFIPERFSEENKVNIRPYTYMPFGVGPRACIGSRFALLEIKSVLFHLLNSFEITPSEKTQIPLKLNKKAINFSPEEGFSLRLKRVLEL